MALKFKILFFLGSDWTKERNDSRRKKGLQAEFTEHHRGRLKYFKQSHTPSKRYV